MTSFLLKNTLFVGIVLSLTVSQAFALNFQFTPDGLRTVTGEAGATVYKNYFKPYGIKPKGPETQPAGVKVDKQFKKTPGYKELFKAAYDYFEKKKHGQNASLLDISSIDEEGNVSLNGNGVIQGRYTIEKYYGELLDDTIHDRLLVQRPDLILPKDKVKPAYNYAGAEGAIKILYCSPIEYIALWATENGIQNGDSGDFVIRIRDFMYAGEMTINPLNSQPITYFPGMYSTLPEDQRWIYHLKPHTRMMDYGRPENWKELMQGGTMSAFWSGEIAPTLFISHDNQSLKTQWIECMNSFEQNGENWVRKAIHSAEDAVLSFFHIGLTHTVPANK